MRIPRVPGFPAARFVAEALSVTAGVLLAFSVDAWWSTREQNHVVDALRKAARAEALTNRASLDQARVYGDRSVAAAGALIDHIGPMPDVPAVDSLGVLFVGLLSNGPTPLELAATDRLLSSADREALTDGDFHRRLLKYRAAATDYSNAGRRFEIVHEAVITQFGTTAPTTFLSAMRGVHGPTDFPVDMGAVLSNPDLEGAIGNLAVWTDNLNRHVDRLMMLSDSVWLTDADATRGAEAARDVDDGGPR